MTSVLRLAALAGALSLLAACNTTGTSGTYKTTLMKQGVTSTVGTHTDLSKRTLLSYENGMDTLPVLNGRYNFLVAHKRVKLGCLKPGLVTLFAQGREPLWQADHHHVRLSVQRL